MAFLGVTGYYHGHIENYSQCPFPLTELTKKNKPDKFQMNGVELSAFDYLKKALISFPVCSHQIWMFHSLWRLTVRSSVLALYWLNKMNWGESIQLQILERNCCHKRHFSTVEKEYLAVLLTLKNFERYIFGVHVTIITDHNCLKWFMTMSLRIIPD